MHTTSETGIRCHGLDAINFTINAGVHPSLNVDFNVKLSRFTLLISNGKLILGKAVHRSSDLATAMANSLLS